MGPLSAPAGERIDPGKSPHEKCQDRGNCTGPGCRVRTGKTYHKRTGHPTARADAEFRRIAPAATEDQESAA